MSEIRPLEAIADVSQFLQDLEERSRRTVSPSVSSAVPEHPLAPVDATGSARRRGRPPALPFWPIVLWGRPDRRAKVHSDEQAILLEVRTAYRLILLSFLVDVVIWTSFLATLFGLGLQEEGWKPGAGSIHPALNVGIISIGLLVPMGFALFEVMFYRSPAISKSSGSREKPIFRSVLLAVSLSVTLYLALAGKGALAVVAVIVTVGILTGLLSAAFGERTGWVMMLRIVLIVMSALATAVPLDVRFAWRSVLSRYLKVESADVKARLGTIYGTFGDPVRDLADLRAKEHPGGEPALGESGAATTRAAVSGQYGDGQVRGSLVHCMAAQACDQRTIGDYEAIDRDLKQLYGLQKVADECAGRFNRNLADKACPMPDAERFNLPVWDSIATLLAVKAKVRELEERISLSRANYENCTAAFASCVRSPEYLAVLAERDALRDSMRAPPLCGTAAETWYKHLAQRASSEVKRRSTCGPDTKAPDGRHPGEAVSRSEGARIDSSCAAQSMGERVAETATNVSNRIESLSATQCIQFPDAYDILSAYFELGREDLHTDISAGSWKGKGSRELASPTEDHGVDFGVHLRSSEHDPGWPREMLHLIAMFLALVLPMIVVLSKITARRGTHAYLLTGAADAALSDLFLGDLTPSEQCDALLLMASRRVLTADEAQWLAAVGKDGALNEELTKLTKILGTVQILECSPDVVMDGKGQDDGSGG